MTAGIPVWDITPLEARKAERGKALAASAHYRDLQISRDIAKELARDGRVISADDVRAELAVRHPDITGPFDFMGSCFKGKEWRAVGLVRSKTAGSHANLLRTWQLSNGGER